MSQAAKQVKPNTSELLPFDEYDNFIVSFSGGKDSTAMVLLLLDLGVPKEKIELWHQAIDGAPGSENFMDWACTENYVTAFGKALGITTLYQWREGGFEREMLREDSPTAPVSFQTTDGDVVTLPSNQRKTGTRRKFPQVSKDLSCRWCSAYLKIDVAARCITNDPRFLGKKVLYLTGERRQEGGGRAYYAEVERHRSSSPRKGRRVDQWRPVIDWTEEQVWAIMERHGIDPHPAYKLGFGRVSCMTCIFGNKDQWATIQQLDGPRFERIADYEVEFGYTIQRKDSVRQQAAKGVCYQMSRNGFYPKAQALAQAPITADEILTTDWQLPSGAFQECGGPS
jgi:3'-phosphoadenosine 5'-phosphosulfate sulfotransferase (PAPS reductase)/FAD synthetase